MTKRRPFNSEDELLKELVKNEEHLSEYIAGLYSSSEEVDGTYLNAMFGILRDKGLLNLQFINNTAKYVSITIKGYEYEKQIDKTRWKDARSMFEPLLDPYREDFLEILKQYPENSFIPYGTKVDSAIIALRTRGYLTNFIEYLSAWGVSYTYSDKHYLDLEESFNQKREKPNMNIKFEGGNNQFNVANDNAIINATQNIGIDSSKLIELITALQEQSKDLSCEDKQTLDECLEVIQSELTSPKPKKSLISFATKALQAIGGSVEFLAAVATLIQFIHTITSTLN